MSVSNTKMQRTAALYNAIPNFFWSILNLAPIAVFCYRFTDPLLFYWSLAGCSLSLFLPRAFFDRMQLGQTPAIYHKLGVHFINRFTQHGAIINQWIRKKYPQYRVIPLNRRAIRQHYHQTYMFEKFHFLLFLFFLVIIGDALVKGHIGWVLILLITNILYNVYPVLLQQYVRIKLAPYLKR
ncbi:hypothetical protein F0L74_19630 [Chitinophaga agrisoli]|uniref:Glycosyl-4,4'-diaponeurosporenoate acyltransferase n=1 Tax=Chitinophaga agrisoli TaxID=2607653 RepID=A0A5B2VH48_9BACT|nr:hypothetical protein [Chitinophaga agrisoli]KAA2238441.1 hypothetical protein F0L74_19630 [Chitinophaga agrisoli]